MRFITPVAITAATIAIAASAQTTHTTVQHRSAPPAVSPAQAFMDNCAACHQQDGKGIQGAFPALAGSKLAVGQPAGPIRVVLNGRAGMPAFKADLTNQQIAAALTFVRGAWGNHAKPITPEEVAALRVGEAPDPARKHPIQAN